MNRYIAFLFALISFELCGQAGVSPAKEVNIFGRSELSSAKEVDISNTTETQGACQSRNQRRYFF